MTHTDPKRIVKRFITEVLEEERHDVIRELFVESLPEPTPTITGDVAESVDGITAAYEEFHRHVSINNVEFEAIYGSNKEILALWSGETAYHQSFRGIRPSGKSKRHLQLTRVELDNDRIRRVQHLRDTLETVPPPARVAHTSALETLETGVVAVDQTGEVIHMNSAALDVVGRNREEVLGVTVRDVFDDSVALLYPGETTEYSSPGGQRTFDIVASPLEDERYGVTVGRLLLLHDVTERKRRIQRLQVLNRILRHNLRNELNTITGHAHHIRDLLEGVPNAVHQALETIIDAGERLSRQGEKARQVQAALEPERRTITKQDLAQLGRRLATRARDEYQETRVEFEGPEEAPIEAAGSLQAGLWALVENACEHTEVPEPEIRMTVEQAGSTRILSIADNGPGIPDHELAVLEAEEETPLEHGSGLGLWLAHWVVGASHGRLSFDESDPRGTVVRVEVPAASSSATPD